MSQFTFYTPNNTDGHTKALLESIQQTYGFIPNLFAYMAEAPTTVEAYVYLTELLSKTSFSPAQQQVALLAASIENQCEFCTAAHLAVGKMSQAKPQTLDALQNRQHIEDDSDRELAGFVKKVVKQRGHLSQDDMQQFFAAGFTKQHLLEVMLIVSIKTLTNYINHTTQPEVNQELLDIYVGSEAKAEA